jgi:aminoglycoside phosphotransferase (APT) family kinase protein
VCPWLPGAVATRTPPDDPFDAARVLGRFVAALHTDAPLDAPLNPYRGVPLSDRDEVTRERIDQLSDSIDPAAVVERWEAFIAVPGWNGPPLWLHGDLHPANVLVHLGRVSAVIDFGDITSGDPATDLASAWMIFPVEARATFREAYGPVDDDTWERAKGWALALALAYLANSADNPVFARLGRQVLDAVLADS